MYTFTGFYGGKDYHSRGGLNYWLWWDIPTTSWIIGGPPGTKGTYYWQAVRPGVPGIFTPCGTATGEATVSLF